MDIDLVVCPHCGNEQFEDCDSNDGFVCENCEEIFHYDKHGEG